MGSAGSGLPPWSPAHRMPTMLSDNAQIVVKEDEVADTIACDAPMQETVNNDDDDDQYSQVPWHSGITIREVFLGRIASIFDTFGGPRQY
ncbi:hypothetical protein N9L68_06175 [bacterium]|nr:hypothetical protein [bacterium]